MALKQKKKHFLDLVYAVWGSVVVFMHTCALDQGCQLTSAEHLHLRSVWTEVKIIHHLASRTEPSLLCPFLKSKDKCTSILLAINTESTNSIKYYYVYILYTVCWPVIDPPCVELDLYALSGPPCCRRDRFSLCVKTTQSYFVVKLVMTNIQYPVTLSNKVTINYLLLTGLELWSNE